MDENWIMRRFLGTDGVGAEWFVPEIRIDHDAQPNLGATRITVVMRGRRIGQTAAERMATDKRRSSPR